jgi:PAS domain-containing protein
VAIAVAELLPSEAITYCNREFERITGKSAAEIERQDWEVLPGVASALDDNTSLGEAIVDEEEYVGTFTIDCGDRRIEVEAWSNTIESDEGVPVFRLVALAATGRWRRAAGGH